MEPIAQLVQGLQFQAKRKRTLRIDSPNRSVATRIDVVSLYKLDRLANELLTTRSGLAGELLETAINMAYFEAFAESHSDSEYEEFGPSCLQPTEEEVINYIKRLDEPEEVEKA